MLSQRVLWAALTATLVACWYLILEEFFHDSAPGLVVFGTFLVLGFSVALMPSFQTKRPHKVMFLAASVVSAGLAIGLNSGLFESVTLLPDSHIDVSRSVAVLHMQNTGLTDLAINKLELGNISFTLEHSIFDWIEWPPGEAIYFYIFFVEQRFGVSSYYRHVAETEPDPSYYATVHVSVDGELTPSTFQDGVSYLLVLTTAGLLRRRFDVEAKHVFDEELDVKASARRFEHGVEINIRFNNTGRFYSYIYSLETASVTFLFEPSARVTPYELFEPPNSLLLDFLEKPALSWSTSMLINKIVATPTPQLSMLEAGETYEVLVRTMADKLYTANVTI